MRNFTDMPETRTARGWRIFGYLFAGVVFSLAPAAAAVIFLHETLSTALSIFAALTVFSTCVLWTVYMGWIGRLMIPNRLFGAFIWFFLTIMVYGSEGAEAALVTGAGVLLPLALILFGDFLGAFPVIESAVSYTKRTPGVLLAAAGWFILIGAPLVAAILSRLI